MHCLRQNAAQEAGIFEDHENQEVDDDRCGQRTAPRTALTPVDGESGIGIDGNGNKQDRQRLCIARGVEKQRRRQANQILRSYRWNGKLRSQEDRQKEKQKRDR